MTAHVLEQRSPTATARERHGGLLAAGTLLAVVLAAHGAALFDGPFFDDHWQAEALRTGGWGWDDLTRAATFELPSQVNHLWWQDTPLQIRYARPLAMLVMKAEYALTGGGAAGLHALGLTWHWLTGLLVYGLAHWALRDRWWAFAAAVLFVLNPHSVAAVGWIAAHNAILSGLFLVAAMLVCLRESTAAAVPHEDTWSADAAHRAPASFSPAAFAACTLLWAAAVLCRESAIIFPVLALVADADLDGWTRLRRRARVHATLWLLAGAYMGWRLLVFDAAQPPEPYFHAFDGPSYLPWAAGKMLRLLTALVLYTPMFSDLSSGGGWVHAAVTNALMAGLLLAISARYFRSVTGGAPAGKLPTALELARLPAARPIPGEGLAPSQARPAGDTAWHPAGATEHGPATAQDHGTRSQGCGVWTRSSESTQVRGRWLWPIWTVAAFASVVPVIMLPHFAYVSAAGWSIMLAILLSRLAGRKRAIVTAFVFAATVWSLALHRVAWRGIVRSEQIIHAGLPAAQPADVPAGTKLFLINLPMAGVYLPAAARQAWGVEDLEGHVLTFAPEVLWAEDACTVEVLGPCEILVSAPPPGTFGGPGGRMVLDLTRQGRPLEAGEMIRGAAFDATVVQADAAGVRGVKFTFPEPLASAAYRFYAWSPRGPAERLHFGGTVDAGQRERQARQWREANAGAIAEAERYLWLMDVLGRIVRSDVFLTGDPERH